MLATLLMLLAGAIIVLTCFIAFGTPPKAFLLLIPTGLVTFVLSLIIGHFLAEPLNVLVKKTEAVRSGADVSLAPDGRLHEADEREFAVLERSLVADARKGVRDAVERARARLAAEAAERQRLASLYAFERALAAGRGDGVIVGLDEVGRGPLAGPLAVGAVVLPAEPFIEGLNDSKQVKPEVRERIAVQVKAVAVAWTVEYVEASDIDACGMTASLALAFRRAIRRIEEAGVRPDVVLLDGNPMRLDEREVNVVKGDGKCASIAAASIVAKVERDALMCRYAEEYPEYGFDACKGYASAAHIEAIKRYGLTPIHRATFCTAFTQPALF